MPNHNRRAVIATLLIAALRGAAADGVMRPSQSAAYLRQFIAERGLNVETLTSTQITRIALDFFQTVGVAGLQNEPRSDMLLYQWGMFDWGHGEFFEFDITRQFIESGKFGDDAFSQLHLTAYYVPTPLLRDVKVSNLWCESHQQVSQFASFILSSDAYLAVQALTPARVELGWGRV